MFYIVALGNPGDEYRDTRHNIGWLVLDGIREHFGFSEPSRSHVHKGLLGNGLIGNEAVQYLYPETFMNQSGQAVRPLVPAAEVNRLVVLHDDVALAFGEIKISFGRGSGGQNGAQSIIDTLGTKEFIRVRLGIAPRSFWTGQVKRPASDKLAPYVLGRLNKKESSQLPALIKTVAEGLETIVRDGYVVAMNKYN